MNKKLVKFIEKGEPIFSKDNKKYEIFIFSTGLNINGRKKIGIPMEVNESFNSMSEEGQIEIARQFAIDKIVEVLEYKQNEK